MKHRWDKPIRPDLNTTRRACLKCPLIRITRHEDDNTPRHWIEWEREGRKIEATKTPVCEEV